MKKTSLIFGLIVFTITILQAQEFDKYGGYRLIQGEETGFFHLEKMNNIWWIITPEGNAFLSMGVNHVVTDALKHTENKSHWLNEFSLNEQHTEEEFLTKFQDKVKGDLALFNFNVLGAHSPSHFYASPIAPYIEKMEFLHICHWQTPTKEEFKDVFSPEFETYCEAFAKKIVKPNDPFLLGYFFTDCPIFTERDAAKRGVVMYGAPREATPTWPNVLRNLGAESKGKQVYVDLISEIYNKNIKEFNSTYKTHFNSFNDLLKTKDWRTATDIENKKEQDDNFKFLLKIIDQYYKVAVSTVKKLDPNHIILGDKLNGNTDTPSEIIQITSRYTDVVYFQMFGHYEDQKPYMDKCSKISNKPIYNGDGSFSVPSEKMPHPNGPHCKNQEERAKVTVDFATRSFSRADFVGWDHCGWFDHWNTYRGQQDRQMPGLQDPFGNYHKPMIEAFSKIQTLKYKVHNSNSFK